MAQGAINRRLRLQPIVAEPKASWWLGAIVFQFFSAMYGGYFGAGNGILMLAAMGFLGLHDINRANGIKNFLGICINSIAVLSLCAFASGGLAGRAADGGRRACSAAILARSMAVRVKQIYDPARDCRDWVCDHICDAVETVALMERMPVKRPNSSPSQTSARVLHAAECRHCCTRTAGQAAGGSRAKRKACVGKDC